VKRAGRGENPAFISPGCDSQLLMLLVALLFKVAAVPFHMWLPGMGEQVDTMKIT